MNRMILPVCLVIIALCFSGADASASAENATFVFNCGGNSVEPSMINIRHVYMKEYFDYTQAFGLGGGGGKAVYLVIVEDDMQRTEEVVCRSFNARLALMERYDKAHEAWLGKMNKVWDAEDRERTRSRDLRKKTEDGSVCLVCHTRT